MSGLPEGWAHATLSLLCKQPEQRVPLADEMFTYIDIASVDRDLKTVSEPQRLLGADAPSRARKLVERGDVIVSMTRPNLNAVALIDEQYNDCVASTGFDVLKPIEVEPRWIFAAVRSARFVDAMCEKVQGALYPAVKSADIREFEIPLPPLAEQTRIAQKLDELLAQVGTLKARIDGILALLKPFRQSVLAAAVSGRLTEEWRVTTALEYTQDTDGYPEAPLDFVADFQNGYAFKSEWFSKSGDIQVAKIGNVRNNRADLTNSPAFVSSKIGLEYQRFMTVEGDLLLSMTGTKYKRDYGYACAAPVGILVNQRVGKLSPRKERIVSSFLLLCLQSAGFREQFFSGETGQVSQGNVGSEHIKKCLIPTPTLEEQTEIARRVEQLFAFANQLEAKVDSAKSRIDHLTQSILAKAFRGELVPQDPNDEPACVLLERIKAQRAATPKTKRARKDA